MSTPLQKTASKAALLLQCPRPFSEGIEIEESAPGEAALYGTRFHQRMAWRLGGMGEAPFAEDVELGEHVQRALDELHAWMLPKGNPFKLEFKVVEVETSRALPIEKRGGVGREIFLNDPDGAHHYEGLADNEIAGTADVILEATLPPPKIYEAGNRFGLPPGSTFRVVLDHKTGEYNGDAYTHPAKMPQMQALAEMWDADAVAILHTPRNSPPAIYAEYVEDNNFRAHLWKAHRLVDSGFIRPGPECHFCPARLSCPAKQGELLAATSQILGAALVKRETPMTPGKFHQLRSQWNALEKQALAELKEEVRSGTIIERPDGKTLVLATKMVERLSKKSILDAYGKTHGEEVLEKLRADGALTEVEQEELRAK